MAKNIYDWAIVAYVAPNGIPAHGPNGYKEAKKIRKENIIYGKNSRKIVKEQNPIIPYAMTYDGTEVEMKKEFASISNELKVMKQSGTTLAFAVGLWNISLKQLKGLSFGEGIPFGSTTDSYRIGIDIKIVPVWFSDDQFKKLGII